MVWVVALLVGCGGDPAPQVDPPGWVPPGSLTETGPSPTDSGPTDPQPTTGPDTGDTGAPEDTAHTGDTANPGDTATPEDTGAPATPTGPIPYAGVLHGVVPEGGFGAQVYAVGDSTGDGRDELYALGPSAYYLANGLPEGETDIGSFHVGTHDCPGDYSVGGDTNGDGFEDVWFRDWLFLGPLTGTWTCSPDDAGAWFDRGFGQPNEGDFDLNGDGYSETVHFYYGQRFYAHYGPFVGMMPGVDHPDFSLDALTYSPATSCFDDFSPRGIVLRDYPSAGRLTLVAGDRNYISCRPSSYFYEVTGGPGGVYLPEDAYAWTDRRYGAKPVGDFNQDGVQDIVFALDIYSGPIAGQLDDLAFLFARDASMPNIAATIPDMNGDGAHELLVDGPMPEIVLSGAYPVGSTFPAGIPLTLVDYEAVLAVFFETQLATGDFDGDGKGDFAVSAPTVNGGQGAVFYWSGAQFSP